MARTKRSEGSGAARSWARAEPRQRVEAVLVVLLVLSLAALVAVRVRASGPDVRDIVPDRPPAAWFVARAAGMDEAPMCCSDSPADLVRDRDPPVIVVGAVESIGRGRNMWGGPRERAQGAEPLHFLVMRVRVSKTLRADGDGLVHDGRVYVELFQGANTTYEDGSEGPWIRLPKWRAAAPVGTRVLLFLYENHGLLYGSDAPTEHARRGLPDGARLSWADPQGMVFEYRGRIVPFADGDRIAGWDVHSIDDIVAEVEDFLDRHG